jgi:predicted RNA-binding protein with PUA domain
LLIAQQKGITLDELSVKDGSNATVPTIAKPEAVTDYTEEVIVDEPVKGGVELTPAEMRSRADALYKEAARLRKEADAVDPPKSKKATKETV